MSIDVYIPTPFRRARTQDRVTVDARDVRGLLDELRALHGLKGLVRNEAGEIHDHVTST